MTWLFWQTLFCRLFGHDFLEYKTRVEQWGYFSVLSRCRHCGLLRLESKSA